MLSDAFQSIFESSSVEHVLFLTPNKRLARFLSCELDDYFSQQGKSAWLNPQVVSWSAWTESLWELWQADAGLCGRGPSQKLLSRGEERVLWHEVIKRSELSGALLRTFDCVSVVVQSWQLYCQYSESGEFIDWNSSIDCLTFDRWRRDFEKQLKSLSAISHSQLEQGLIEYWSDVCLCFEQRVVVLYGFSEFSVAQKRLLSLLMSSETRVFSLVGDCIDCGDARGVVAKDSEHELMLAAQWCAGELSEDSNAKLVVVVPDLVERWRDVERVFGEVLLGDDYYSIGLNRVERPFALSAGQPLLEMPMVQSAMALLRCCAPHDIPVDDFCEVMGSVFFKGGMNDFAARMRVGQSIRSLFQGVVSRDVMMTFLRENNLLAQPFAELLSCLESVDGERLPSDWVLCWQHQLNQWLWPGQRVLDSHEYQQYQRWQEALIEFAALDEIMGAVSYMNALGLFEDLLAQSLFQAQSPDVSVHILGMLEAAGMKVDGLWWMGVDHHHWPAAAKPNPYLPKTWQFKHQVPRSSSTRELEFARHMTGQLLNSASQIVLSYTEKADDIENVVSPLVASYFSSFTSVKKPSSYKFGLLGAASSETVDDAFGQPYLSQAVVKGGTSVFKEHLSCPFKGYVQYRLGGRSVEEFAFGLAPRWQGQLVHRVLELCWLTLKRLSTLRGFSDERLSSLVAGFVAQACQSELKGIAIDPLYLAVEASRLQHLILKWLAIETKRIEFEVVSAESSHELLLGDLKVKVRIDRVDRVFDEGKAPGVVVIDYKTGQLNQGLDALLLANNMLEPQLPLYSVGHTEKISGVSFARVAMDRTFFKGVVCDSNRLFSAGDSSIKLLNETEWVTLQQRWRDDLLGVSDEIFKGYAAVAPRDDMSCKRCHLQSVCRVHHLG